MEEQTKQAFLQARKEYLKQHFSNLNAMQQEAVFAVNGPLLILAGAGSGKTTVLVNRIANIVSFGNAFFSGEINERVTHEDVTELSGALKNGSKASWQLQQKLAAQPVQPWQVLAITFTNKAAGELKARLAALIPQGGDEVAASTFHSACVRILRRDADKLGFPKGFTIYDSDDQQRVLKDIYKQRNIDDKFLPVRSAASRIGHLKDKMISPFEAQQQCEDHKDTLTAQIYSEYANRLQAAGAFDFDDLIYFTVRLLEQNLDIKHYYQNRWKYVLVDEYQDTSHAQFRLVQLLTEQGNVCVVGDDDQSIYRFRGATIENILSFEETFPGAKVIRLEQNYRSTQNILDAANCVISNNTGRKGKTLWTDNGEGELISVYKADSEQDEAMHIANIITQNIINGTRLQDHAVLYRMNAQSNTIETYFARAGIPYKIVGGLRFYDRKEIKDMIAYISIVVNPKDDLRLRRIINEPARKIGTTTVDAASQIAQGLGISLLEVVAGAEQYPALSRSANALKGFMEIYHNIHQAYEELPADEFVEKLPFLTGYEEMLRREGETGQTRLENIQELISSVKTYVNQQGADAGLEGFLEEVALISDLDSYDEEADTVVMMTLHAAKGLEYEHVFMVGLEEGVFPGEMARFSAEDIEEERRLCYVGITRAKKMLHISHADYRMLFGRTRRNPPSRFLEEINSELMERSANRQSLLQETRSSTYASSTARAQAGLGSFRSTLAQKEPQSQQTVSFKAGDFVEHKIFGRGTVQKVTPMAGDTLIEIDFEMVGKKKTMANYAPLSLVQE